MQQLLVGADVEVFVQDIESGVIESSIGIIPGSKDKPYKTKHGFIHKDNVLAEFNMPPADNRTAFRSNVLNVLADLKKVLAKQGKTYAIEASYILEDRYLNHYRAKRFGCDPDFNVWELHSPPRIIDSGLAGNLRTAGGHIHLGFPEKVTMEEQIMVAKSCELHIGLPSVILDNDTERKKLYGVSGVFRHKPYGIEYRVPSNFWIKNKELIDWAFKAAVYSYYSREYVLELTNEDTAEIQRTINNNDKDSAYQLCATHNIRLPL